METPALTNPETFPSDEVVFSFIGENRILWNALFGMIEKDHPEFEKEWRYYNDGKSWLMKVTRKTKTVFWVSVFEKAFKTTFYFTDKAAEEIGESKISAELKKQFREGKRYNKIRGITITYSKEEDIEYAGILIGLRLNY